ncbi:hypothetical protein SAMN02745751_01787 [Dethiosulfatibacter aminovorans DSM 17477]|uniref:Uncharacterized protein n=1 Tax=Dethiosulfatibacter aminovorans DSM 17477 TaxID=1121476 RepID=A0A1M6GPJ1_9FIRM|nr:hypothetical protein SAMN02745751_01787 [Dethiosulfatibacter aminovorans DSM 17477]
MMFDIAISYNVYILYVFEVYPIAGYHICSEKTIAKHDDSSNEFRRRMIV